MPVNGGSEIGGDQQVRGQELPRLLQLPWLVHLGQLLHQVLAAIVGLSLALKGVPRVSFGATKGPSEAVQPVEVKFSLRGLEAPRRPAITPRCDDLELSTLPILKYDDALDARSTCSMGHTGESQSISP